MIIDIDDKITTKVKKYNKDSIIEYEMASRDNRIGEITTVATGILNQYTTEEKYIKQNEDNISLLRIYQGKEIDFQKTSVRWQMNKSLRQYAKKIPFFLLYNYPKKLQCYNSRKKKNKTITKKEDKLELNAYYSPSPMNELCSYVLAWEKKNILQDLNCNNTKQLVLNNDCDYSNRVLIKQIKHIITQFSIQWRELLKKKDNGEEVNLDEAVYQVKNKIEDLLSNDSTLLANYVIYTSYLNISTDKSLVWMLYSDVILDNIKKNSPPEKNCIIQETSSDTQGAYEYLGKYYTLIHSDKIDEEDEDV